MGGLTIQNARDAEEKSSSRDAKSRQAVVQVVVKVVLKVRLVVGMKRGGETCGVVCDVDGLVGVGRSIGFG